MIKEEVTTMDVLEAVRTVLAVRQFKAKPVPEATIRDIIDAGRLSASSMNGQPWHFIVIQDPATLTELGSLVRSGPYIAQAPLAIVITTPSTNIFGLSDVSRAIQSMVLTAWSAGVGSNWVGFSGMLDAIKPLLAIPADQDIPAILPFGYPVNPSGKGKKQRKPLNEVVSRERFGQPYE